VFCGTSLGARPIFEVKTRVAVRLLVSRGHRIIYGGGKIGLMGVVAEEALKHGGTVIGIIPRMLVEKELLFKNLTEVHIVDSMHERKKMMSDLSDMFLALPGGAGTLDELFEQWTWTQLGIQSKACGVLDIDGYFDPLRILVNTMVDAGFLHERHRASLIFDSSIEELLDALGKFRSPAAKY
jgi:hypothetical protein